MGSGCTSSSSNQSKGCPTLVSDRCVKYTGPAFPQFNVCTGDTVAEDIEIILNKLAEYAIGEGIELPDITNNCTFVTDFLAGKDKDLVTLVQALFDIDCNLKEYIDEVNNKIEPPFSFTTGCITVPGEFSRNKFIQAIADKTCQNTEQINQITDSLGDTNDLLSNIEAIIGNKVLEMFNSCQNNLTKTGSGNTASILLTAQCPIGTILFGNYPLSSFDNTGKGLNTASMCGWAVANGNNGTVDMRGWTPAGATNVQGPALLPSVTSGSDLDLVTNVGSRKGQYKITLASSQLPNHNHTVTITQNPHTHNYNNVISASPGAGYEAIRPDAKYEVDPGTPNLFRVPGTQTSGSLADINVSVTGITGGSGQSHENRPPTYYGVYIQRIS